MTQHLYELTAQMQGLQALIDEGTVPQEALEDTLEALTGDIESKGYGILMVLANLSTDVFDKEIKRLTARKKTIQNHKDWLMEYLRSNMERAGIEKIESPLFNATLRKATKVVDIVDEKLIPEIYRSHKPATWAPDKNAIANRLKSGGDVPGTRLHDGKRALLIK